MSFLTKSICLCHVFLTPCPSVLVPATLDYSVPKISFQRKKGILSRRQALPRRRPGVEIFRVQHVARCGVLQPVYILDGGDVQAEKSGTTMSTDVKQTK